MFKILIHFYVIKTKQVLRFSFSTRAYLHVRVTLRGQEAASHGVGAKRGLAPCAPYVFGILRFYECSWQRCILAVTTILGVVCWEPFQKIGGGMRSCCPPLTALVPTAPLLPFLLSSLDFAHHPLAFPTVRRVSPFARRFSTRRPARVPFAVCRLPFAVCRLSFAVCRLPVAVCRLPFRFSRSPLHVWCSCSR